MNLIEELGLEKCQAIVHGAPELTTNYKDGKYYEEWFPGKWTVFDGKHWQDCKKPKRGLICIIDLRTAIANHEKCQHEWNEATSNGDAYRFFVCKHCDSTQNYVPFEVDYCTDIRNHISPNTKVSER